MKKSISIIAVLLCILQIASAEAPELRNMMPNSWRKLARLSGEEENELQKKINDSDYYDEYRARILIENKEKVKTKIYKENCGSLTIYRVLSSLKEIYEIESLPDQKPNNEDLKDFFDCNYYIYEMDFVKINHNYLQLLSVSYNYEQATVGGYNIIFENVMYRKLNKNDIGVFYTEGIIHCNLQGNDIIYNKRKEQLYGNSSCKFYYLNDLLRKINQPIKIESSQYLFDPKCPLKYSVQNAFDGNPATSYVENTEDDLMKIVFQYHGQYVKRLGIINGYSSNEYLYKSNNRIKKIECGILATTTDLNPAPIMIELNDFTLSYQFYDFLSDDHFYIKEIYKGNKYNDTCIAEMNLFTNLNYWLFGDIDE